MAALEKASGSKKARIINWALIEFVVSSIHLSHSIMLILLSSAKINGASGRRVPAQQPRELFADRWQVLLYIGLSGENTIMALDVRGRWLRQPRLWNGWVQSGYQESSLLLLECKERTPFMQTCPLQALLWRVSSDSGWSHASQATRNWTILE